LDCLNSLINVFDTSNKKEVSTVFGAKMFWSETVKTTNLVFG
jgi:hypothetical protein